MIASGAVGHLEMADMAVEVVRGAFGVTDPARLEMLVRTDPAPAHLAHDDGEPEDSRTVPDWARGIRFDEPPHVSPDGLSVVGWVDNVLVEAGRDTTALPGLELTVARARLTDPNCAPLTVPSGNAAELMHWLRESGGNGITVESVGSAGRLAHAWATRMLCSDSAPTPALGRVEALDGTSGDPSAEAVESVLSFVKQARRDHPDVVRPTRVIIRMDL